MNQDGRRIQAAIEPRARAFYARAEESSLGERLTDIEKKLAAEPLTAPTREWLTWWRALILDELTLRERSRRIAALMAAITAGNTTELDRLTAETTPADRDAIRDAAFAALADLTIADYDADRFT